MYPVQISEIDIEDSDFFESSFWNESSHSSDESVSLSSDSGKDEIFQNDAKSAKKAKKLQEKLKGSLK